MDEQQEKTGVRERFMVMREKARNNRPLIWILGILGVGGLGFLGYKQYDKKQKEKKKELYEAQNGDDPNVGLAIRLDQALNYSGWDWAADIDGTNEGEILRIGEELEDWPGVMAAYKAITEGKSLAEDLADDLSAEHLKIFDQLWKKDPALPILNGGYHLPKKKYCVVKKATYLRTEPKVKGMTEYNPFNGDNIVDTLEAGQVIGVTTGKQVWDYDNTALFAEIIAITEDSKAVTVYCSRFRLDFVDKNVYEQKYKDQLLIIDPDDLD